MKKTFHNMSIATLGICTVLSLDSCDHKETHDTDLVLLYTTDVHGACLPFDFNRNAPARTSLANVSTYLNQERAAHPDGVLLFDTGDFLQGQPSMYYYNYVATDTPHLMSRVANYLGYDALGVGNHDIETGESVYLDRLPHEFQMPWLCANAIDTRTDKPMFTPYTIIERQGLKIAILGMITPNIHAWLPKSLWPHLEFQDMVECARQWVPIIQEQENPNLLIGLFHSGGDYTVNGSDLDTFKNENGGIPAATKVPGFDLVLLGHDHQSRQLDIVNVAGDTVRVLDAQTQASKVGRADIHLSHKGGKCIKSIRTSLIDMNGVPADSAFVQAFATDVDRVNQYVDKPLGTLTAPLRAQDGLVGPSEFMDFIHDAQLWATGADISFASVLSANAVVEAGPITMRQLFTLYKYENQMFKLKMTGDEVRRYLEYGFAMQYNRMQNANDHLLAFKTDDQGQILTGTRGPELKTPTFNYTSAAGIRYTVNVSKPAGERVSILSMSNGKPFDPTHEYTVAINSYQACGGGGFIPKGLGWDDATLAAHTLTTTTQDVRQYVADYILKYKTITPRLHGDWQVLPTDWWQQGKTRDLQLLSPTQR